MDLSLYTEKVEADKIIGNIEEGTLFEKDRKKKKKNKNKTREPNKNK